MKKLIKEHISLVTALFTILFTSQLYFVLDRTIEMYEITLKNNYSMITVSGEALNIDIIKNEISIINKMDIINPQKVIDRLKDELNKEDLGLLKDNLPYFYKVFLSEYPNPDELKAIKNRLKRVKGIIRVETYSKTHDQIYKLLVLFKDISNVFLFAIFIVSMLLVIKEMRIWQFEHTERMHIMSLFGAPIWMRSAVLFRVAILDAFLSSFLVVVSFIFLDMNGWLHELFSMISVEVPIFLYIQDTFRLILISAFLSTLLALVTILKNRELR